MNNHRHSKGVTVAGQAVGGRFAARTRAEAAGDTLSTATEVRPPVTVASLQAMDRDGTLMKYVTQLKASYDQVITRNTDLFEEDFSYAMADIDTRDFLLRVLEDDAVKGPEFASGEDDRVPYYLNHAIDVVNARGALEQRKAIRWGKE